jgi:hypothetical protein
MTRSVIRSLVLLGVGLSLTACAQHAPRQANCFTFRDATARSTSAETTAISAMGDIASRGDTACEFVLLGAGR